MLSLKAMPMSRSEPMPPLPDPAAGMERMKELTRRLLAVPKTELDKIRAKEQAPKKKGKK